MIILMLSIKINKLNSMRDTKSSKLCDVNTTLPKGIESRLIEQEEIILDMTGSEMDCDKKNVSTLNKKLSQRHSGFAKYTVKSRRPKPQMLGDLTFREIAEKRKDLFKSSSIKHTENDVKSLTATEVSDSSLKPHKRVEENLTTYISPHMLVGKTITLQQGGIRHIKFLSEDSNTSPSSKNLLTLDDIGLKLTPHIIVGKIKPRCLPSKQTWKNRKDLRKTHDSQKMSEQVGKHLSNNSVELNDQPSCKSLPHSQSIIHDYNLHNIELGKELPRRYSELELQECSSKNDIYNCSTLHLENVQRARLEKVTKCSPVSSSHDNLTILSQVACGELGINKQLGSKEETEDSLSLKKKVQDFQHSPQNVNYEYASDHCHEQKRPSVKGFHCNENSANVRSMNNKTCPRKRFENNSEPSSQRSKMNSEEKPMFAWCTQYITHDRSLNTRNYYVTKKYELPLNQKQTFSEGSKKLSNSLTFNDNFKIQHNCQKQNDPYKSDEVSRPINTFNLVGPQRETLTSKTCIKENPHIRDSKGMITPKSELYSNNEVINDSCVETTDITLETFFSSNSDKKLTETNDEVVILKEILVTKSSTCNAFRSKGSDISKPNCNKQYLCETESQSSSIESDKVSLAKTILTETPPNKEQSPKFIHKNNVDRNVARPCLETRNLSFKNISSQTTLKDMKDSTKKNKQMKKAKNTSNLEAVKNDNLKLEESFKETRQCNIMCTKENKVTDPILGKPNYPLKKCYVLIERLNELNSPNEKIIGVRNYTSSTNAEEVYCDLTSSNICSEKNREQNEECVMYRSESGGKGLFQNNRNLYEHHVSTTSSDGNILVPESNKVGSEVSKCTQSSFIGKFTSNATNSSKIHKINLVEENTSTSQQLNKHIESHINNGDDYSVMPMEYSQGEYNDNNSKACCKKNNDLQTGFHFRESTSQPENKIGDEQQVNLGNGAKPGRKKKIALEQVSESSPASKKVKLSCKRPKKFIGKNMKPLMKRRHKLKTKPDVNVKTDNKRETKSTEVCKISNVKDNVKLSPEKTFSGNREIYSLLSDFMTLGCTLESERKLRRKSTNISQKSSENSEGLNDSVKLFPAEGDSPMSCNQITQNNAEVKLKAHISTNKVSFMKNNKLRFKNNNGQGNLKKALDPSDTLLVPPAFTKPKEKNVTTNSIPINHGYSETSVSNLRDTTTDDIQDLQAECNVVRPIQQNIPKCGILHSSLIQLRSNGEFSDNITRSPKASLRPKRFKPLEEKNYKAVPRKRELKTKHVPLNNGDVKLNHLDFSRIEIENEQDHFKIKSKKVQRNHPLERFSSISSNVMSLPSNLGKKNVVQFSREGSKKLKKSPVLNSKQECIASTDVALHNQTNDLKYTNNSLKEHVVLTDYKNSGHEFSCLQNGSVMSLDLRKKQSRVRRRPSFNYNTFKKENSNLKTDKKKCVRNKPKANPITLNNRRFAQKVSSIRDKSIRDGQQKQKLFGSNKFLRHSLISSTRLEEPTHTNKLQPHAESPRNKSSGTLSSTAPSSLNTRPMGSYKCISEKDKESSTEVKCSSSTSDSTEVKIKPTNNQISRPSAIHDKVRLLIMEQLKRSRRIIK